MIPTPEDPGTGFYIVKTSYLSATKVLTLQVTPVALPVCVRTCGVQFISRGTGRSAEQSGASAGCCRGKNMTVRLNNLTRPWKVTCTLTTPVTLQLQRQHVETLRLRASLLLVSLFSMVKLTFRKFVYGFPPLSSNIQLGLHHLPPHALSLTPLRSR